MKKVLFICTRNSVRSQMAEGLLRKMYGEMYEVHSAGIYPSKIDPLTVEVMQEIGIDMSCHYSKGVERFVDKEFDYVVTVCDGAKEECPFFAKGKVKIHKGFEDPASFEDLKERKKCLGRCEMKLNCG